MEAGKDAEKERVLVERMRTLLQPFVLRRLKIELKDQLVEKAHVMKEVGEGRRAGVCIKGWGWGVAGVGPEGKDQLVEEVHV
jgi:hypothetical protein